MTVVDPSWGALSATWHDVADAGAEVWVRRLVARQSRSMRLGLAAEIILTVVILSFVGRVVYLRPTPEVIGLGIVALVHSAIVWGFAIWNRSGTWRPLAESTRAYLALARMRATREQQAARFVIWLVSIETVAAGLWIGLGHRQPVGWYLLPPAVVVAGAFSWAIWQRRRAGQRLRKLAELGAWE